MNKLIEIIHEGLDRLGIMISQTPGSPSPEFHFSGVFLQALSGHLYRIHKCLHILF